jgi:hypothetical protein
MNRCVSPEWLDLKDGPYLPVLGRSLSACSPLSLDGSWQQWFANCWWSTRDPRPEMKASPNPLIRYNYYYCSYYYFNYISLYLNWWLSHLKAEVEVDNPIVLSLLSIIWRMILFVVAVLKMPRLTLLLMLSLPFLCWQCGALWQSKASFQ